MRVPICERKFSEVSCHLSFSMPRDLRRDMERSTFSCTCLRSVLMASA